MPLHPDDLDTPPDASVTCLMVAPAKPERLESVQNGIFDFCRQTLARKRLVIVLHGGTAGAEREVRSHVAGLKRHDIHILTPSGVRHPGQLRNFGLQAATGELFCLWDDDSRSHPERLARQAAVLTGNDLEAVYLQEAMHYFPDDRTVVCGNWRTAAMPGHPGTLMARRSAQLRYPVQGDLPDNGLAEALMARGRVGFITGAPHLHVGLEHSGGHAPALPFGGVALTKDELGQREALLRAGLEAYGFAAGVAIRGSDGVAFAL